MSFRKAFSIPAVLIFLAASASPIRADDNAAYRDELITRARAEKLAQAPHWLRLLHFRHTWMGHRSQEDGPDFFLSRKGKTNPQAELDATLSAFFDPPPSDPKEQPAGCRFPARFAWVKEKLQFDPARLPDPDCPRLKKWMERLDAGSVSLIFASAYLNNPASMYGHTFLRLNKNDAPPGEALNSYSINFAAVTDTNNGISFAIKGLIGLYPGKYTTTPYYMKVQQYNNIENREIWEYDLSLSPEQVHTLVLHLWEMGSAYFDYYFLTENCSFQLLPFLEVARPDWDLSRHFRFKAIPVDTMRAIIETPGAVTARRRRPSTIQTALARRAMLSPFELRLAEAIARRGEGVDFGRLEELDPIRQALVLESSYDYFRYLHDYARYQSPATEEHERRILARRGALGIRSSELPPVEVPEEAPPESGHKTGRISLGMGANRHHGFEELSLRGALHDLTEDPAGYTAGSRLEMFHVVLRHDNERGKTYLDRFTMVDILSLSPLDRWVKGPSWSFYFGTQTADDLPTAEYRALVGRLGGGAGLSVKAPAGIPAVIFGMVDGNAEAGGILDKGYRLGSGPKAGVAWTLAPRLRLLAEGGWRRYFWGRLGNTTYASLNADYELAKDWGLRLELKRANRDRQGTFSVQWYM